MIFKKYPIKTMPNDDLNERQSTSVFHSKLR